MTQNFSNGDQRSTPFVYIFGDFRLLPMERTLLRSGKPVALGPKAFDALLLLVNEASHLVRKQDLMDALWPSTFVAEANLTNLIVSLRKAIGPDAILTVSGHGYRFAQAVTREAKTENEWLERFAKARELVALRSQDSLSRGRELLWLCLTEQPSSAPAWTWFARCNWILAKTSTQQTSGIELAKAALQRAFEHDPDLAIAHQFAATIYRSCA